MDNSDTTTAQGEINVAKIEFGLTAKVVKINHGYELCILREKDILNTREIKTYGYPCLATIDISPDGRAIAITIIGNDGFEQDDYTLGIFEINKEGKIQTLYNERRESTRHVIETPSITWMQDNQVLVEWIITGSFSPSATKLATVNRPAFH